MPRARCVFIAVLPFFFVSSSEHSGASAWIVFAILIRSDATKASRVIAEFVPTEHKSTVGWTGNGKNTANAKCRTRRNIEYLFLLLACIRCSVRRSLLRDLFGENGPSLNINLRVNPAKRDTKDGVANSRQVKPATRSSV